MTIEMDTKINLKDTKGRVIQTQILNSATSNELNVEKLENGVYYLELLLPQGKAIRHQFNIIH